jgi:hypothetical protein
VLITVANPLSSAFPVYAAVAPFALSGASCLPQLPQKTVSASSCALHCGHCIVQISSDFYLYFDQDIVLNLFE